MLKTLKVAASDLDIGMYVSALDRPWLGTPFATQGFFVKSRDDIDLVAKYCDYVIVDSRRSVKSHFYRSRSRPASTRVRDSSSPNHAFNARRRVPVQEIFQGYSIRSYRDDSDWEEEEPQARRALDDLIEDVDDIFDEVDAGQKLDIMRLRKSVVPVVDSIARNPDACLWVARLKQHDRYTYKHSLGAAIWSVAFGRQLGLSRLDLRSLSMGCMLMDVGKLRIDPALLQAERELTTEEMAELAAHVNHGVEIVRESGVLNQDVLDMVAHHHERFDGSGYPNGLRHNEIPPFARIAGIVDTYDAITSKRSYASALAPSEAIKQLYMMRDTEFQAELVEAFIQAIGIYPAGTLVELSSGEIGVVVAEYRVRRLRPKVMILLDAQKRRLRKSKIVDLHRECGADGEPLLSIKRSLEPESYGIDLTKIAI